MPVYRHTKGLATRRRTKTVCRAASNGNAPRGAVMKKDERLQGKPRKKEERGMEA